MRVCRDGRGLGSKLVSFTKGFSKHPHILAIFKVDSEYLRFPFKVKADYFILYSVLVHSFVIFLIFLAMNKRRRTNEASLLNYSKLVSFAKGFSKHPHILAIFKVYSTKAYQHLISRASHISVSVKGTFWYLSLFFLEWSTINFCYSSRFISLGFTIRTVRTQKTFTAVSLLSSTIQPL